MNIYSEQFLDRLGNGGIFLTAKTDDILNTMTIGWGSMSIYWGMKVLLVPVRFSRFTHEVMEKSKTFTVSVPSGDEMKKELMYCGTKSGRDVDKFKELGLTAVKGKCVDTPIISECELHYECEIVGSFDLTGEYLADKITENFYRDKDFHTIYIGKIVDCYKTK